MPNITTTPSSPLLVLCGPSGVGKGTIISYLLHHHPKQFGLCVSCTTRKPRPGEVDGKHYYFLQKDDMLNRIVKDEFVEYQHVHGNLYGTSRHELERLHKLNSRPVLDVDVKGLKTLRRKQIPLLAVAILPDSISTLETRLQTRGTETQDEMKRRLQEAVNEIQMLRHGRDEMTGVALSDYIIENTDSAHVGYPSLARILGLQPPSTTFVGLQSPSN